MDVEGEEEDDDVDVEGDDVEEEDPSQVREAHFVRACAVVMGMDRVQEKFCVEIYRNNAGRQSRARHFVRACAIEMHMDMSQEPFCVEIYRKKARSLIPRYKFCASLRSRNAHVTRASLSRNLEGKCRTPRIPRRLNTGPQL